MVFVGFRVELCFVERDLRMCELCGSLNTDKSTPPPVGNSNECAINIMAMSFR